MLYFTHKGVILMFNISEFIVENEGLSKLGAINFELVYATIIELLKMRMITAKEVCEDVQSL